MDTMAMVAESINITATTMMTFGMKNSEMLVGERATLAKARNISTCHNLYLMLNYS